MHHWNFGRCLGIELVLKSFSPVEICIAQCIRSSACCDCNACSKTRSCRHGSGEAISASSSLFLNVMLTFSGNCYLLCKNWEGAWELICSMIIFLYYFAVGSVCILQCWWRVFMLYWKEQWRWNIFIISLQFIFVYFQIAIPDHNLELWPGYITNVSEFEHDICLQAEIVYKVLRRDTAYDLFRELSSRGDSRVRICTNWFGTFILSENVVLMDFMKLVFSRFKLHLVRQLSVRLCWPPIMTKHTEWTTYLTKIHLNRPFRRRRGMESEILNIRNTFLK